MQQFKYNPVLRDIPNVFFQPLQSGHYVFAWKSVSCIQMDMTIFCPLRTPTRVPADVLTCLLVIMGHIGYMQSHELIHATT